MRKRGVLEKLIEELGYDPSELIRPAAKPVTAYKLFRTKPDDDQLYPLFVDADKGMRPSNRYQEAIAGDIANDKGQVKSKLGPLAYRPGWHAGDLPIATHIGGKSGKTPKSPVDYRPDNQVWAEISMPNKVDWQRIANDRAQMSKAGKPISRTAHITDQVPYQGHYRYKTNPNMTGEWLIGGDMKINRVLEDAEVEDINARFGLADLPRLGKLGMAGMVGAGALADSEEANALPKGKAAGGVGVGALAFNPQESYAAQNLDTRLEQAALAEEHGTMRAPGSPIAHGLGMFAGDVERSLLPQELPMLFDASVNVPSYAQDMLNEYAYEGFTPNLALEGALMMLPWLRTGNKTMRRAASAVFPQLYEDEDE